MLPRPHSLAQTWQLPQLLQGFISGTSNSAGPAGIAPPDRQVAKGGPLPLVVIDFGSMGLLGLLPPPTLLLAVLLLALELADM